MSRWLGNKNSILCDFEQRINKQKTDKSLSHNRANKTIKEDKIKRKNYIFKYLNSKQTITKNAITGDQPAI